MRHIKSVVALFILLAPLTSLGKVDKELAGYIKKLKETVTNNKELDVDKFKTGLSKDASNTRTNYQERLGFQINDLQRYATPIYNLLEKKPENWDDMQTSMKVLGTVKEKIFSVTFDSDKLKAEEKKISKELEKYPHTWSSLPQGAQDLKNAIKALLKRTKELIEARLKVKK